MSQLRITERTHSGVSIYDRPGASRGPLVLWCVSASLEYRLRAALADVARVECAMTNTQATTLLKDNAESIVLLEVPDAMNADYMRHATLLLQAFPHSPSIAVYCADSSDPAALARLAAIRISEVVVVDDTFDRQQVLNAILSCKRATLARRVWQLAGLHLSDELETLLVRGLRLAVAPLTLRTFAREAGMPERSLRKYCLRYGFPSPQWLIGWSRVLLASHFLDEPGRTVDGIARLLGYSSPSAMRNQLKRYTGFTATDLREHGALRTAARELQLATQATGVELTSPKIRLVK